MLLLYDNIEEEWESADFQEYLQECLEANNPSIKTAADYLYNLQENLSKEGFEKTRPLHIRRYTTHLIAGYYRGKHVALTNQYIANRLDKWGIDLSHNGLIQPRLIKLLGQLSMLHTCNQEDVLKLDYISNGYAADYIHPRFLAEMLRLGDLLDADNSRFETAAELVNESHALLPLSDSLMNYCVIFPVLSHDDSVMRYRKTEFISLAIRSDEFDKLADYVLEHRADPPPVQKGTLSKLTSTFFPTTMTLCIRTK